MGSLSQARYASNLRQNYGYPLRIPEPNSHVGEFHRRDGLQIGDVGYINDYGEFLLLFNIGFPIPDELREDGVPPYNPIKFWEPYTKPAALPRGHMMMTGVTFEQHQGERPEHVPPCDPTEFQKPCAKPAAPSEDHWFTTGIKRPPDVSSPRMVYNFAATSETGAILILPHGASLSELRNQRELEAFRELATKYGYTWCRSTGRDSLFLVTGTYKTRSWTLGSFNKGLPGGEILVERQSEEPNSGTAMYNWKSTFELDYRSGPRSNNYENQTVFVKGFKIQMGWAGRQFTVVDWVAGLQGTFASFAASPLEFLTSLFPISSVWRHGITVSQVGTWNHGVGLDHADHYPES